MTPLSLVTSKLYVGVVTIHGAPNPKGITILELGWQAMCTDIVVRATHREALDARWEANAGEVRMSRRREWPTMVHRWADGNTGRHFVIQQPANLAS
jgi:hypothetical protein